ncbi:MAG: FtsB family cell division protein [Phycisphaerae bacterium]
MLRNAFNATLFWAMTLVGGGGLAAALWLPALLEYRDAQRRHADKSAQVAAMEYQNTSIEKQIEHSQNDPAYIERLARREFGLQTPGVETVRLAAETLPTSAPATSPTSALSAAPQNEHEQRLAMIEHLARTNPLVSVFILPESRATIMCMCGGLLLAAIVLMNPWNAERRATAAPDSRA